MKTEREAFKVWVLKHPDNLNITSYEESIMLDAWQASAQREGCRLVPCEPTKEMLIAADNCVIDGKVTSHNIYKAMIGASE